MLGPVKFVIDNYPKVFKTVSSLETNFIHGADSMIVSFDSGSTKHHVVSFLKGECSVFLKKIILWMKIIHYPNTVH